MCMYTGCVQVGQGNLIITIRCYGFDDITMVHCARNVKRTFLSCCMLLAR